MSFNGWLDTENVGILFSLKKEGNPAICDIMDEPGGHYGSEISHIQKDKY